MLKKIINYFLDKNPTKPAVDVVLQAMLDRPNDFDIEEYRMVDIKTNYIYWIGCYPSVESPFKLEFTGYQARRFRKMVLNLKTYQIKEKLGKVKVT